MEKYNFITSKSGKIGDIIKKNYSFISYNQIQKMLRQKDIKINGKRINENINIDINANIEFFCEPTKVKYYDIIFNDENIVVVNKRYGIIVSTKDKLKEDDIALQELVEQELNIELIPYNRIDMNTSGLVMFAKNEKILKLLQSSEIKKHYIAEVVGKFNIKDGKYKAKLEKVEGKIYINRKDGDKDNTFDIETEFKLLEVREKTSLIEVIIEKGKTHQIRAHLAYLGFAIVGDNKYGKKETNQKFATKKQRLLAYKFEFNTISKKIKYLNEKPIKISQEQIDEYFTEIK